MGGLDGKRPNPRRSQVVISTDGSGASFSSSSLDDFVAAYVEAGLVASKQDLITRHPNICNEIQFAWYRQGQVACLFANRLAARALAADSVHWSSACVAMSARSPGFGQFINDTLELASEDGFEAAQLLFPHVDTADGIAAVIDGLCQCDRFFRTEVRLDEGSSFDPQSLLIGLRWRLPCGTKTSEVLGTASLRTMPPTRHTPFPSIVVRSLAMMRNPPPQFNTKPRREYNGCPAVHLADMDDGLGDDAETRINWWARTGQRKAQIVPPTLKPAAKAKVTFALPVEACCCLAPVQELI